MTTNNSKAPAKPKPKKAKEKSVKEAPPPPEEVNGPFTTEVPLDEETEKAIDAVADSLDVKEPVDIEKIPPAIRNNVRSSHFAKEVLEMVDMESKKDGVTLTPRFWTILRDRAIKEAGLPPMKVSVKPLEKSKSDKFLKKKMLRGQHKGKTIAWILKNEKEYLKEFCHNPDWFQKRIQRLLAYLDSLKDKKAAKK